MKHVELGEMVVSRKVRDLMDTTDFNPAPLLYAHERGHMSDLLTGEEMLEQVGAVLRGERVHSLFPTDHGVLRIVTPADRGSTVLAFMDELMK